MRHSSPLDTDDHFHGLINYIYFKSGRNYNQGEFLIEYKGIQPNSDPAAILDFGSQSAYESATGAGQCLVFTFRNVEVRPTAYAIKAGPLNRTTRHMNAHVFQGWNADTLRWETIDERQNLLDLMPGYTSRLLHVDTDKFYRKFRLLHTDAAPPPGTHFAISGFEIHGEIIPPPGPEPAEPSEDDWNILGPDGFNPWVLREDE